MHFKSWDKVFDLSSFRLTRTNERLFKDSYQMMNVTQLNELIDSLAGTNKRVSGNVSAYIGPYMTLMSNKEDSSRFAGKMKTAKAGKAYSGSFLNLVNDTLKGKVIDIATGNIRNAQGLLAITATDKELQTANFMKFNIEWHRKFTLSFACLLLFLIGAPLGAIIRKGGLGMPLVIAVLFFVVFHITSVTGEKLAKTGSLYPWAGMWMATAMLLPIAFVLINQARVDSQILSKEWYLRMLKRLKLSKNK
jgi:lipopolysaccharide export system permease protein